MSRAIRRLENEHRNLHRLLDVLEQQLNALLRGQTPDYYLMRDILQYLLDYPDRYHHPYEDLVYHRLAKRAPREAAQIEDLQNESRRLAVGSRQLLALVDRLLGGFVATRAAIYTTGNAFVSEYRVHMQREEEVFFASAETHLRPTDWLQIDTMFHWRPDPLFGPAVEAEYQALHDRIEIETCTRWHDPTGEEYCGACATG